MHYLKNIRLVLLFAVGILAQSCGGKEKLIEEDTFAQIIGEMYLADQYIDQNPPLRAQTDTSVVYDAIFKKHGYSRSDYQNSVQYYLQKGRKYKEIHQAARTILSKREKELNKLLELERGIVKGWWASDTARVIPVEKLEQDVFIRSVKWLLIKESITEWKLDKPQIKDIPQNIYWWKNNMQYSQSDSLIRQHGVLYREYLLSVKPLSPVSDTIKTPARIKINPSPDNRLKREEPLQIR